MNEPTDQLSGFSKVFHGDDAAKAPYDQVLLETDRFVVVPSKGSLFSNWLLLIPKKPLLNFVQYHAEFEEPTSELEYVARKFGRTEWIWFEHGPASSGSAVGCGVDYAHLHLLLDPPFRLEQMTAEVEAMSKTTWSRRGASEVYQALGNHSDYYAFGTKVEAYTASGESLGSQFFRKAIAAVVGKPCEWNYRTHVGLEHALETLGNLVPSLTKAA